MEMNRNERVAYCINEPTRSRLMGTPHDPPAPPSSAPFYAGLAIGFLLGVSIVAAGFAATPDVYCVTRVRGDGRVVTRCELPDGRAQYCVTKIRGDGRRVTECYYE